MYIIIWCGEVNKYLFKVQNLWSSGGTLAFKYVFIGFAVPNLMII